MRKLTDRQLEILRLLKSGMVLMRPKGWRSYGFYRVHKSGERSAVPAAVPGCSSGHVLRLQARYLDAHDPATGAALQGVSAMGERPVEFRLKAGAFQ